MLLSDTNTEFYFSLATFLTVLATVGFQRLITWLTTKKEKREHKVTTESMHKELVHQSRELKDMRAQLFPNGGHSLFDKVDRTQKEMEKCSENITVLQKSVETLESSQRARLEITLNQSPDPIFLCDETGDCTFVNVAMTDLFGMNAPHFMNRRWLKALHDQEEREKVNERWNYAVKMKIPYAMEYNITNQRDKRTFRVKATADPVIDSRGNFMWYLGKIKIIT